MNQHCQTHAALLRALQAPAGRSSDHDLNPEAREHEARLRPASVLIGVVERPGGARVILTRRAARLKHHPGQVAFPGGKQDAADPTPLAAALREAREEIGLLADQVSVLGSLDPHETVTHFLVTPFVGLVARDFRAVPDRGEVEEVFEVPLAFLLDPQHYRIHGRRWQGSFRRYYAIPYGPHYIWGATARMLRSLALRATPGDVP